MSTEIKIPCNWQGYGFGAAYEDAACCNGTVYDLDSCDEPGGPLMHTEEENCPQCEGRGFLNPGDPLRGPMALYRQNARAEIEYILEHIDKEDAEELRGHIDGLFSLVRKLEESPDVATVDEEQDDE